MNSNIHFLKSNQPSQTDVLIYVSNYINFLLVYVETLLQSIEFKLYYTCLDFLIVFSSKFR